MKFFARGVIGVQHGNHVLVGQYTYLTMLEELYPAWDGKHKTTFFPTSKEALNAAHAANGPVFRLPAEGTIEAFEVEDSVVADNIWVWRG